MLRLDGKTAVVTGSARGLGKEIAATFASLGANVVITDVNEEGAKQTAAELKEYGYEASCKTCNVSDREDAKQLIEYAIDTYGSIDILVNNAGITRDAMIHKMEAEQWQSVIDVNLTGVFNCLQPAVKAMREQKSGAIINISSVSADGNIGQVNYAAAKAGVVGMTKTAAKELARYNVRCNAICPGFMNTDMVKTMPDKVIESIVASVPLRRLGEPEDIAKAASFLASDWAKYITGEAIYVSGGFHF